MAAPKSTRPARTAAVKPDSAFSAFMGAVLTPVPVGPVDDNHTADLAAQAERLRRILCASDLPDGIPLANRFRAVLTDRTTSGPATLLLAAMIANVRAAWRQADEEGDAQ